MENFSEAGIKSLLLGHIVEVRRRTDHERLLMVAQIFTIHLMHLLAQLIAVHDWHAHVADDDRKINWETIVTIVTLLHLLDALPNYFDCLVAIYGCEHDNLTILCHVWWQQIGHILLNLHFKHLQLKHLIVDNHYRDRGLLTLVEARDLLEAFFQMTER